MMFQSLEHVCQTKLFGLKLHMFNLVRGSQYGKAYPITCRSESIDEYIDLVVRMHRADPAGNRRYTASPAMRARSTLIAPEWSYRKSEPF